MLDDARRSQKMSNIWVQNLSDDAQSAAKYANTPLPVLKSDTMELAGDEAVQKVATLLGLVRRQQTPPPAASLPPGLPPGLPPSLSPNLLPSQSMTAAPPPEPPPQQQQQQTVRYAVTPVEPMYALYTNDHIDDICVPADGYVTVQSYNLIRTTIARDKLPNYLRSDRPLPVLVTMREDKPTVYYGTAARDHCRLLCLLHGGAMLR